MDTPRGRGRPPKINTLDNKEIIEMEYDVHHVIRVISGTGYEDAEAGYFNSATVDAYLKGFLEKGYKLFSVQFLEQIPEGYKILYVLVKQ
jgi:hypothetical protein